MIEFANSAADVLKLMIIETAEAYCKDLGVGPSRLDQKTLFTSIVMIVKDRF